MAAANSFQLCAQPVPRLNIPVITTDEKRRIESENRTLLEIFVDEQCHYVPGRVMKFSILYDRFRDWLEPSDVMNWSKIRFGKYFSANSNKYPKGRSPQNGQWYIGNISTVKPEAIDEKNKLILRGDMLARKDGEKLSHD